MEQPRIVKRINQKAQEYKSVHVFGFTRNVHSVQNYEVLSQNENITITIAGQLRNKQYLQRAFTFLGLLRMIYVQYGFKKKNIYVFGLDLRILSFFIAACNFKYFYIIFFSCSLKQCKVCICIWRIYIVFNTKEMLI